LSASDTENVKQPKRTSALVSALGATVALTLWMANREPFPYGPLWASLIALLAGLTWVYWLVPLTDGPVLSLRDTALGLHLGGVGYYAQSDFVHIDTGRPRYW